MNYYNRSGNDAFTHTKKSAMGVYFTDWDNSRYYAEYSSFKIGNLSTNYTLSISGK